MSSEGPFIIICVLGASGCWSSGSLAVRRLFEAHEGGLARSFWSGESTLLLDWPDLTVTGTQ